MLFGFDMSIVNFMVNNWKDEAMFRKDNFGSELVGC